MPPMRARIVSSAARNCPSSWTRNASAEENALIGRARAALGAYAESELMIRAGLYAPGADPRLDEAVRLFPNLDDFVTRKTTAIADSFAELGAVLRAGGAGRPSGRN